MWKRDEQRAAYALDQYLRGVRPSAIAAELHVDPSTFRRWINLQLEQIADAEQAARVAQLQAAIESQRAILREAWVAYHREQTREDQRLNEAAEEAGERRNRANHAHTYLRLALIAQREMARLQGLYTAQPPAPDDVTITIIERPAGPENQPPDDYLPNASPYATSNTAPNSTFDPTPDAISDAQTTQLAQTAQLSQPGALASPANSASPGISHPSSAHRSRQRLQYLQSLQQQPAHQLWSLAYSGP